MIKKHIVLFICSDAELSRLVKNLLTAMRIDTYVLNRINPPEIKKLFEHSFGGILIDLNFSPAQGRDIGIYLRKNKATRFVPLIFLDGDTEKVEKLRNILPDAFYISRDEIRYQLTTILELKIEEPIVPESLFEAYKEVPLVKKLAIKRGMRLLLINEPENFRSLLENNDELQYLTELTMENDLILWFLSTQDHITTQFHDILPLIGKGGIWMFWQKKQGKASPYLNEVMVRKLGLSNGLVDYKICSVNPEWTGLKFVTRKTRPPLNRGGESTDTKTVITWKIDFKDDKPFLQLNDRVIPMEIIKDNRKNLQIEVNGAPSIILKSPAHIADSKILEVAMNRMNWIIRKLIRKEELQPFPSKFQYINGEKHLYLGKEYALRIQSGKRARAWFSDPFIEIEVPEPQNHEQINDALQNWYAEQTTEYVSQRTWHFIKQFVSLKLHSKIEFKFRKMKRRWGSCSSKGLITFNKELIRAPREAIDYLIVHELCHLKHHDHSASFYKELSKQMPEWKLYRRMLERIGL
jgi:predicted metal-dependent hydrolase